MQYKIIRSDRKTMVLQVNAKGVTVRAPMKTTDERIHHFVQQNTAWIEKKLERFAANRTLPPLSHGELQALAARALEDIPARVAYYAPIIGVTYGRVTIRNQRTRWGSCGCHGDLNFNCLLMLAPPEVRNYIVIHELCHRKEMNHSKRFYAEVARVMPDYRVHNRWLREHGGELMARMMGG